MVLRIFFENEMQVLDLNFNLSEKNIFSQTSETNILELRMRVTTERFAHLSLSIVGVMISDISLYQNHDTCMNYYFKF